MRSFSFRTTTLIADIVPVTPTHRERLVADTACVIIDSTETPTLVTVNGTTAWDGAPQGGWSGYLITNWEEGKRLVLDPPAPFTVGETKTVVVTAGPYSLTYVWACGTKQITTQDDASAPRVTEAGASNPYAGYVREFVPPDYHRLVTHSDICLRKADPLTAEVPVVPGYVFDIGYDPDLNKLIVFYIHSGKVFVTTADPGDPPTTLVQTDEVVGDPTLVLKVALRNDELLRVVGAGLYPALFNDPMGPVVTPYPPIKRYIPDSLRTRVAAEGHYPTKFRDTKIDGFLIDVLTEAPTTFVISAENVNYDTPGEVKILIHRLTGAPETSFLVGYNVLKSFLGNVHVMGFVPIAPDEAYIIVTDTMFNPGASYAAEPIFRHGKRARMRGTVGSLAPMPTYSEKNEIEAPAGCGYAATFNDGTLVAYTPYPPLKVGLPDSPRLRVASSGYGWTLGATRGTDVVFDDGGLK